MHGETTPFVGVLEEFLQKRCTRSLTATYESNLEMAIELLWFEEVQCVLQMCLVEDPAKPWGKGRGAFVDIFIGNSQRHHRTANQVLVMELKNVTLCGLWRAQQQNPDTLPRSNNEYEPTVRFLRNATEDQILAMKHAFYDKATQKWIKLLVKDTLQGATAQLDKYMTVISRGRVTFTSPGVLDDRIKCHPGGCDVLCGYVVICIGGTCVICRSMMRKDSYYSFEVIHPLDTGGELGDKGYFEGF